MNVTFIKSTVYVSYIVPSTELCFFLEGGEMLVWRGRLFQILSLRRALIRSGALIWSWALIRAFTASLQRSPKFNIGRCHFDGAAKCDIKLCKSFCSVFYIPEVMADLQLYCIEPERVPTLRIAKVKTKK